MFLSGRKMNRRVADGSTSPTTSRDKGVRRVRQERTKTIAFGILYTIAVLYILLFVRLYTSSARLSLVPDPRNLGTFSDNVVQEDTARIEHIPARSDTGLFVTMGSYVIDGDASAGTHPSASTNDLILLLIGVGDFTKTAQRSSDAALKRPPQIPKGLVCLLQHTPTSRVFRLAKVNFHSNGTAYQGKISPSRGALYFGERAVWLSCPIPEHLDALRKELISDVASFRLQVIIESSPGGDKIFDSNPTTPTLALSSTYRTPLRKLTLCSSAIYGLTGSKWIIEYIEYHRAAGFDAMDLYVHNVGDLVHAVLDEYVKRNSNDFFIRLHDWTRMIDNGPVGFNDNTGVGRGVQGDAWEHGQRLTRNDCYLRNRGRSKWIMFCDVDELFTSTISDTPGVYQGPIESYCERQYAADPKKIACSFSSVTTPPNAETADPSKLILERIDTSEARCQPPYNCGRFHYGREKYAIRTARGSINPNGPFFYHAISQNYDISEQYHELVPESVGVVRHYAGHFSHSRKGGLPPHKAKYNPLHSAIIKAMRQRIYDGSSSISQLYAVPNQKEAFLKLDRITDMWRFAKPGEEPEKTEQVEQRGKDNLLQDRTGKPLMEERFMTFEYFGGRLNNQLWTLDWVFRTALALNRTAILGTPQSREHYIGFPSSAVDASFWDMSSLRAAPFRFKFAWEVTDREDRELLFANPVNLPKECVWEFTPETKHVVKWAYNSQCNHRRFHFSSGGGLVHSYKADTRAYGVDPLVYWRHMQLHPDVMQLTRVWWAAQSGAHRPIGEAVGLHFRSWREAGGDAAHATKVCTRLSEKLLSNAKKHFSALEQTCGSQCSSSFDIVDVHEFWSKHGFDATCQPANEERIHGICANVLKSPEFRMGDFFVATDHETVETDEILKALGARMISGIDTSNILSRFVEASPEGLPVRKYAKSILPILLDVSGLLMVGRFFGSPASTLSQAVCLWRRAFASSEEVPGMCQLVWYSTFSDQCDELCF